jgi:hypothetical protein
LLKSASAFGLLSVLDHSSAIANTSKSLLTKGTLSPIFEETICKLPMFTDVKQITVMCTDFVVGRTDVTSASISDQP